VDTRELLTKLDRMRSHRERLLAAVIDGPPGDPSWGETMDRDAFREQTAAVRRLAGEVQAEVLDLLAAAVAAGLLLVAVDLESYSPLFVEACPPSPLHAEPGAFTIAVIVCPHQFTEPLPANSRRHDAPQGVQ